ncbi:ImmA/IrrE family metallo-endopeptidase [Microcoleus sp. FACHB-1515]|nr:ImmA/IrrE family metallo-endopeptidase [Microcoleus sp. FACHB-1515]MBD2093458.1 ImmA/IrrE family metallo-endopeptidase [Microcoleus sp. FACHB-1515]
MQADSREWQAQHFAICLLMPRFKIEEVRRSRNLLNWKHLDAIKEELGVSKRNLLHRLKDLELVQEVGRQLYPSEKLKSDAPLLKH